MLAYSLPALFISTLNFRGGGGEQRVTVCRNRNMLKWRVVN